jgi:hypothetical protein
VTRQALWFFLFFVVYLVLIRWVLPKAGIGT